MRIVNYLSIVVLLLFLTLSGAHAQRKGKTKNHSKKNTQKTAVQKTPAQKMPPKKVEEQKPTGVKPLAQGTPDEQKVKDIISFFEFMLNMLGSSTTSSRDKDVMITESYAKIFQDSKVQIEDDLDEAREVITNKDVVAYLKDVDFFFQDVKFEFAIENIQQGTNAGGKLFYKVTLSRNLKGVDTDDKAVNKTIRRFIEINYDPDTQDLKIVSIYTNEFNEREALTNWWKELSFEWQSIFKKKLNLSSDSLSLNQIKDITSLNALDLSSNNYVQDIKPLAQLTALSSLNLSATKIHDLTPIRNLTELTDVNLSHTKVIDLAPLKYAGKLNRLNIGNTNVNDISVVENMQNLEYLDLRVTPVADLTAIATLKKLSYLNLANIAIADLSPIQGLDHLQELILSGMPVQTLSGIQGLGMLTTLTIDSTRIQDLQPLAQLPALQILHANYTRIANLDPLKKLSRLEKIYCDQTAVTRETAEAFRATNPNVLVIFDSKDLKTWWENLSSEWREILSKRAGVGIAPTKEELAMTILMDSVNLSGAPINNIEPLRKLTKLRVLIADRTTLSDLSPLQDHREITSLDITETAVQDITVIANFSRLAILRADQTKIEKLEPLYNLRSLQKLYVDNTSINEINAQEFLDHNSVCLIIFKTVHLNRWWKNLSAEWKAIFYQQMLRDSTLTRENLHRLVERKELTGKDIPVKDLMGLSEFVRLSDLHLSGSLVTEIPLLENLKTITSLHITDCPLQKIETLDQLAKLVDLNIANTPVSELKTIGRLTNLKNLNCAGTQIKKLTTLESLSLLEFFDCSNTNVSNLDPLLHLPLKTLKCYNSKVSKREIENFKKSNPSCTVVYYR